MALTCSPARLWGRFRFFQRRNSALCFPVSFVLRGTQIGYKNNHKVPERHRMREIFSVAKVKGILFFKNRMFIWSRAARRHRSTINHACTIAPRALLFELRISKKEHNTRENYGGCVLFKIRIRNLPPVVLPAATNNTALLCNYRSII